MSPIAGQPLTGLCWNLTVPSTGQQVAGPLSVHLVASLNGSEAIQSGLEHHTSQSSRDKHALLYIIVVLLFYSTGIVIAIVNYLKREKKEIEEEKAYDDYAAFRSDPDKMARYFRVQRMISYLNKVEKEKELAAIKERLQGRVSVPIHGSASGEHSKTRIGAMFGVGSDHVPRNPFKHKHHYVTVMQTEVNAARDEQGISVERGKSSPSPGRNDGVVEGVAEGKEHGMTEGKEHEGVTEEKEHKKMQSPRRTLVSEV